MDKTSRFNRIEFDKSQFESIYSKLIEIEMKHIESDVQIIFHRDERNKNSLVEKAEKIIYLNVVRLVSPLLKHFFGRVLSFAKI